MSDRHQPQIDALRRLRRRLYERLGDPDFYSGPRENRKDWHPWGFGKDGVPLLYEGALRPNGSPCYGMLTDFRCAARRMLREYREEAFANEMAKRGVVVCYSYQSDPLSVEYGGRSISEVELVRGWAESRGITLPPRTR